MFCDQPIYDFDLKTVTKKNLLIVCNSNEKGLKRMTKSQLFERYKALYGVILTEKESLEFLKLWCENNCRVYNEERARFEYKEWLKRNKTISFWIS